MSGLIKKGLVLKDNKLPAKYYLSDEGRLLAKKLFNNDSSTDNAKSLPTLSSVVSDNSYKSKITPTISGLSTSDSESDSEYTEQSFSTTKKTKLPSLSKSNSWDLEQKSPLDKKSNFYTNQSFLRRSLNSFIFSLIIKNSIQNVKTMILFVSLQTMMMAIVIKMCQLTSIVIKLIN
jgi:hypothetical protein